MLNIDAMDNSAREQTLERMYMEFNARNIDAVLKQMHPDVEWPNGWEGGTVRGHAAVRDYWTRQWAAIDPTVTPMSFIQAGEEVAVRVHQVIRDAAGTLLTDGLVDHTYGFERELIRYMRIGKPEAG